MWCVKNKRKTKKPGNFEFITDQWNDSMPAAFAPIWLPALKGGSNVKCTVLNEQFDSTRRISLQ